MNERIRELAEQAVNAVDNPFPDNPLNDELGEMYIPDCFAEKFAELIVKECADYVRTNYDSWDAEPLAFNMEKNFGLHGDYA